MRCCISALFQQTVTSAAEINNKHNQRDSLTDVKIKVGLGVIPVHQSIATSTALLS
jgi:hypothetical protein